MKGILIIDHGSVKEEANHMLECVGELVQRMAGERVLVRVAHMELAAPTIADGFEACIAAGATEIVVFPYMLSPGKHSTRDIPRMVAEIAAAHPGIPVQVTAAFGVSEQLAAVVLSRSGVPAVECVESHRCARPAGTPPRYCGAGCAEAISEANARAGESIAH
ncbi:MAG TPA: CbiX/SirB N-terminal domain-containing protein [Gemmatimonadaceae bacterium]|nr:CbiX/SirB N-terminal domain-containing protein [Gemmatimonadaceae bacterium]